MIETYILEKYISHLEKILISKDQKKKIYTWNKIKNNIRILNYATKIEKNKFKSNIIVSRILKDRELFETTLYKDLVNLILKDIKIAETKTETSSSATFLLLIIDNENLSLTQKQKELLISIAKESRYTENFLKEITSSYGTGITDIKYKLLINKSFSYEEKKDLFNILYLDDEIKLAILKELEWKIIKELKLKIDTDNNDEIYELDFNILPPKIIDEIKLCKYIKTVIPEEVIKRYMNII